VVVPSRVLERVATGAWRQPAERVRYLPNGVDLRRFVPRPEPGAGAVHAGVVIGNVATFRAVKNQAMLVRALASMRERTARLLLVGDGPDRAACEALAGELGVAERVTFAGTAEDTAEVYGGMDVFALSSRTEQMPLVVLEAMACGLPVVATDVGDVREMVAEPNRELVVGRDDVAGMAAALDRLVGDGALRAELGAANRRRCEEQFEAGACLGRYAELYERVARGG
jgi:glycosyltransferase involved in cell wall biosynthesis